MQIFVACINGFSLDAYWNAKAQSAMTEETTPKARRQTARAAKPAPTAGTDKPSRPTREGGNSGLVGPTDEHRPKPSSRAAKVDIDYSRITNPTLYRAILAWRNEVARERKMPPAYIMPMKAVIGITNLEPLTPEELQSIPGIGPKTITDHGADLLETVAAHRR